MVASDEVAKRPKMRSKEEDAVTIRPTAVEVGDMELRLLKEKSETN